jgi:hypothetical protein
MGKQKYEAVKDLSKLSINLIETLDDDLRHERKYVKYTYEATVGGRNMMWHVHDPEGDFATISTGQMGTVASKHGTKDPKYKHYVLTKDGISFLKREVVVVLI